MFNPKWNIFIRDRWSKFKFKWKSILSEKQIDKAENIVNNFQNIQNNLSDKNFPFFFIKKLFNFIDLFIE